MKILSIVAAGFALMATVSALAVTSGDASAGPDPIELRSNFDVPKAVAFDEYELLSPGANFNGAPLAAVLRRDDEPSAAPASAGKVPRADWVSFFYTTGCTLDESFVTCENQAEVQVWPICERNFGSYARARENGSMALERIRVRNVPAAISEADGMLELYTGDSTVVLFADTREELLALAEELTSVNASALGRPDVGRGQDLPPPAAGAVEGTRGCSGG